MLLKKLVSSTLADEAQTMVTMMSKHPLFQLFSRSEIASLLSVSFNVATELFHESIPHPLQSLE